MSDEGENVGRTPEWRENLSNLPAIEVTPRRCYGCGHIEAHHSSWPQECWWAGCGCPRFVGCSAVSS